MHDAAAQAINIAASTYLGGRGSDVPTISKKTGNAIFIAGTTTSPNFPTTDGSGLSGTVADMFFTRLDASTGATILSRVIGGSSIDSPVDMRVIGNTVHLLGQTSSANFPTTDGSTFVSGPDLFYMQLDATTGNTLFAKVLGAPGQQQAVNLEVVGNDVYILGTTFLGSYPTTDGSTYRGFTDLMYVRLSAATGAVLTSTIIGGSRDETAVGMRVAGNQVHILGKSYSPDYPATNGSTFAGVANSEDPDMVYTKIDATTGAILNSTYLGGKLAENPNGFEVTGNTVHIVGDTQSADFPVTDGSTFAGGSDLYYSKINSVTGQLVYSTYIGGSGYEFAPRIKVSAGEVHMLATTESTNYPTTTGIAKGNTAGEVVYTKLNASSGAILTSAILNGNASAGTPSAPVDMYINSGTVDILAYTGSNDFPVTNGTVHLGALNDIAYARLNSSTGEVLAATYLGGTDNEGTINGLIESDANGVYIVQYSTSNDFPVTNASRYGGAAGIDVVYTRLTDCLTGFTGSAAVSPSTQTVCVNGVVNQISMGAFTLAGSAQPTIYRNGVATQQGELVASYQWQVADDAGGPWTDIPGGASQNYVPAASGVSKYYRRLATVSCNGVKSTLQTGDVASVIIGSDLSPTITQMGTIYSCPGASVTLGGTPTATAAPGATIASYLWTPVGSYSPGNTAANPSVTTNASTIYQVLVTDSKGCQQIGQVSVSVVAADAGVLTLGMCSPAGVRIGTQQTPIPGAVYAWTSTPAGFTSSEAQPLVNPSVSTVYHLTLTLPLPGGGTCSSTDDITVEPVAAPANNGGLFAGTDVTVCAGGTAVLGTPAEAGFTYTWAPGNYLTDNHTAQTTFQPGNLSFPVPNPFTYYVTALKNGCTFVDQVQATVIKANAGIDGCGPRTVGTPDQTPGINETYTWTKISGPGSFLGPTNLPIVSVSESVGGTTVYQLAVTLNGVTCTDEVVVPDCGCLVPVITVNAPKSCPSFDLNGGAGTVSMTASSSLEYTYTWSPAAGLSSNTGATVFLTDNVQRTYTVTATSMLNPAYVCSNTITVNHPAWSLPVFESGNVAACPGTSVNIGQPPVAGYSYQWQPAIGLSSATVSNPSLVAGNTGSYSVLVTDVGSGCTTTATTTVTLPELPVNPAGKDLTICGTATGIKLGSPAVAGVTYSWTSSPAGAVFSPGSDVAEPTVDVTANTTYTVVATNTATGCSITDDVTVTVGSPVSPFSFTNTSFCPSTSGPLVLPAGPSGMASYLWTSSAPITNPTSNGPAATSSPRPSVATTYTLKVTNASGCSAQASVTFTPTGTRPDAGADKSICLSAGPVQLGSAANPTGAGITYLWSPATGLSSAGSPNPTFTPTSAGTFTYTVSKTQGGCTTTDQVVVAVQDFSIATMASPTICKNACVQIGTAPAAGVSYTWTPSTGLSSATIANPTACPDATTTYTLTATNANGCVATGQVVVSVSAAEAPSITVPPLTTCLGAGPLQLQPTITPAGTYQYAWTPNDGLLSDINIASPLVTSASAGNKTYTLTVTNPTSGCSNSAAVNVTTVLCQIEKMMLGSTVFMDNNNDGVQSGITEIGIAGLLVKLYEADGTTVISSTYTDSFGNYLFTDLPPGSYVVGVTPNSTYTKASTAAGTDNQVDSDNNGTQGAVGEESKSSVIVLTAGQEPVAAAESGQLGDHDDENDANGDLTVDFGFFNPLPFPVDLIEFKATPGEEIVELSWKTANEVDFSHYELERSSNGKQFTSLATIPGKSATFYAYQDQSPLKGRNYYRLKMHDEDGSFKTSRIIAVVFDPGQKYLFVQNPAAGKSFVAITNIDQPRFRLHSLAGVEIPVSVTLLESNKYLISVTGAPAGLHLLTIDGQDKSLSKKVIIP